MAARFCSNCGSAVDLGATFCGRCGARLTPGAVPAPAAATPYAPPPYAAPPGYAPPPAAPTPGYPYAAAPYPAFDYAAAELQKRIGRTKTGVLLIFIGFLFNWIPDILPIVIGGLVIFVGAILTILGRKAFGARHNMFVILAIVIFIVGLAAAFALEIAFNILIAGVIDAAISGIASVLFVHELENKTGKYLLYAGYAASVIVSVVILALVFPIIDAALVSTYRFLDGVSSVIFAGAYFIAYSRIQRREIPPPLAPPAPAPGWPAPGTPAATTPPPGFAEPPWRPPESPPPGPEGM